jgi:uncharacterized protein
MAAEALTLTTSDGVTLEAELARPPDGRPVRAGMVMCHPHPQFGGTMRSIVISALFGALPETGVTCLRFNFRGVEGSGGSHEAGEGERQDALAAIDTLSAELAAEAPLVLVGWSFGADVALSIADPRLAAWFAIATPLKFGPGPDAAAGDPRPKLLALAERDEFRAPTEVMDEVAHWTNTRVVVVSGASHFFVGATDKLVVLARELVDELSRFVPRSAP